MILNFKANGCACIRDNIYPSKKWTVFHWGFFSKERICSFKKRIAFSLDWLSEKTRNKNEN